MGLYGGTLVDHFDRRVVGLAAQSVAFVVSLLCALQAWLGNTEVWVLYVLVAACLLAAVALVVWALVG